jgi:hypothetical protein
VTRRTSNGMERRGNVAGQPITVNPHQAKREDGMIFGAGEVVPPGGYMWPLTLPMTHAAADSWWARPEAADRTKFYQLQRERQPRMVDMNLRTKRQPEDEA